MRVDDTIEQAKGRWIAFMEENGYAFSYTKYGVMNEKSQKRNVVIGGLAFEGYLSNLFRYYLVYSRIIVIFAIGLVRIYNLRQSSVPLNMMHWITVIDDALRCEKEFKYTLSERWGDPKEWVAKVVLKGCFFVWTSKLVDYE